MGTFDSTRYNMVWHDMFFFESAGAIMCSSMIWWRGWYDDMYIYIYIIWYDICIELPSRSLEKLALPSIPTIIFFRGNSLWTNFGFGGFHLQTYAARARPVPRRPSPRSKGTLLLLLPRHAVAREKGRRTAPVRRAASVRKPRQRFVNRVWRSCWFMLDIFRSGEWTQNFCWRWNCKFAHFVSLCMQRSEIWFVLLGTQRASVRSSRRASAISHLDCNSVVRDGMPTTMKPLKIGFPKKGIFIYFNHQNFQGKHMFVFGRFVRRLCQNLRHANHHWILHIGFFRGRTPLLLQCSWRDLWMSGPEPQVYPVGPGDAEIFGWKFYRNMRWQEAKSNFSGVSSPWSRYRLLKSACWTWDLGIRIK